MSTFIGQLVGFGLIVFLVVRYVVPPVRRLMAARQDTVRHQLDDSVAAANRLTDSTTAHTKAVESATSESKRIVDEAQSDATRITLSTGGTTKVPMMARTMRKMASTKKNVPLGTRKLLPPLPPSPP